MKYVVKLGGAGLETRSLLEAVRAHRRTGAGRPSGCVSTAAVCNDAHAQWRSANRASSSTPARSLTPKPASVALMVCRKSETSSSWLAWGSGVPGHGFCRAATG